MVWLVGRIRPKTVLAEAAKVDDGVTVVSEHVLLIGRPARPRKDASTRPCF